MRRSHRLVFLSGLETNLTTPEDPDDPTGEPDNGQSGDERPNEEQLAEEQLDENIKELLKQHRIGLLDELDKEQLQQLHNATLKAADSCFELKKLCATALVPTGTLVAVFTNKQLDISVFAAGFVVVFAFWLADSTGYYYQRKLRASMTPIWQRRASRCTTKYTHAPNTSQVGWFRAAFNQSMVFYGILAALLALGVVLLKCGIIGPLESGTTT